MSQPKPMPFPVRKTTRLKDYDYSKFGKYFITICTEKKLELFWGSDNELNEAGLMAAQHLGKLQEKFGVFIDCYAIMPNHLHAIIEIKEPTAGGHVGPPLQGKQTNCTPVGADPCVGPNDERPAAGAHQPSLSLRLASMGAPLQEDNANTNANKSLSRIVQWYKTMTTNAYIRGVKEHNWKPFKGKLWQRSFNDHIIRSERSYDNMSDYISMNPFRWEMDAENRKAGKDREKYYEDLYEG